MQSTKPQSSTLHSHRSGVWADKEVEPLEPVERSAVRWQGGTESRTLLCLDQRLTPRQSMLVVLYTEKMDHTSTAETETPEKKGTSTLLITTLREKIPRNNGSEFYSVYG